MSAQFDDKGDLWVEVARGSIPPARTDVAMVAHVAPDGVNAIVKMNLTQYIRSVAMVDTLPRDGEG